MIDCWQAADDPFWTVAISAVILAMVAAGRFLSNLDVCQIHPDSDEDSDKMRIGLMDILVDALLIIGVIVFIIAVAIILTVRDRRNSNDED